MLPSVVIYLVTAVAGIAMLAMARFLLLAVFAWSVPKPDPRGPRTRRVVALIPAHDEEAVIRGVLSDLAGQEYGPGVLEAHVVADRCTDRTVERARPLATVHERSDGDGTKGAALAWLLERIHVAPDDLIIVLDADARLGPDAVASLVDGADAGRQVMQAYLEPSNPDASSIALAGAMSQWLGNRLIELPKRNLRMSGGILGTGFALIGSLASMLTDTGSGVTEDQDLTDRLILDGGAVDWMHHIRVEDEKPASTEILVRQRARWVQGTRQRRRDVIVDYVRSPGGWSLTRLDRLLQLVLPGRIVSFVVLALVVLAGVLWPSVLAIPVEVPGAMIGLAVVAVVAALVAEGVGWGHIVRLPLLLVFALIWVPERILARRTTAWYHTPHGETGDG